ncbi:2107_t:CDS:2, partial [Scutellospora calospora]
MQNHIPLLVFDMNAQTNSDSDSKSNSDSESDSDSGSDLDNEVIAITLKKGAYRNISAILRFIVPKLVANKVLSYETPIIYLRISDDGRNVERKIKHIIVTLAILNDQKNLMKPERHYTILLFSGTENYTSLKTALEPIRHKLRELHENGFIDTDYRRWEIEVFFSSDWKFLAIILGFNVPNAFNFCPWCFCTKDLISDLNQNWLITKKIDQIKKDYRKFPGHIYSPILDMISMTHYVVNQLHLMLRITDHLWELALNECKNNGHFIDKMRELICNEMRVIGPDKLKVIENFNLSIMLPQAYATKVRKLWSGFSELYKMLDQNKLTGNIFRIKAREWLSIFLTPSQIIPGTNTIDKGLYTPSDITPYIHVLIYHVPEFLDIHLQWGFGTFSCQPVEKKNHQHVSTFFSKTLKNGTQKSAILEILEIENRA